MQKQRKCRARSIYIRDLLLLSLLCVFSDCWAQDTKTHFNLPSDEFPNAILEFYRQSKIEVLFLASDALSNIHTHPVVGDFTPDQALKLMLGGTGLTYRFVTDHSVAIKAPHLEEGPPELASAPQSDSRAHRKGREFNYDYNPDHLDVVLITGTFLHGVEDVEAPLQEVTKEDQQRAAYATVQDAMATLPLVSLNGPREDAGLNNNYSYGAGINLRGLGVSATLVLVDGVRQPYYGLTGNFVDVSQIPISAIDHIEVLPDGASSLYGSDAVAGVVNIILRKNLSGFETQVRYGGAPGGRDESVFSQLYGTHWSGGSFLFDYQYTDATPLPASARGYAADADKIPYGGANYRSFYTVPPTVLNPATLQPAQTNPPLTNQFANYDIFPERMTHAIYARLVQCIGDRLQLVGTVRVTARDTLEHGLPQSQIIVVPSTNPFYTNPVYSAKPVVLAANLEPQLGPDLFSARTIGIASTLAATLDLGSHWQTTLSSAIGSNRLNLYKENEPDPIALASYLADSSPASAFNPAGGTSASTLAAIRRDEFEHSVSDLDSVTLVADGPLFPLPEGIARLAAGAEWRHESLDHSEPSPADPLIMNINGEYGRSVASGFGELLVPLLGDIHDIHATPRAEVTISARFDDYSDFGHSLNPQVRFRITPTDQIKLRASWGTSYSAPKLDDLYDTSQNAAFLASVRDPQSRTGYSTILGIEGNNPNLKQETATTSSFGVDLVPRYLPGFRASLTAFYIDYRNRIVEPAFDDPYDVLVNEAEWSSIITRKPSPAEIAAVCKSPYLQGSSASCFNSAPAAIVNFQYANLGATRESGLDADIRETFANRSGRYDFSIKGAYIFRLLQSGVDSVASNNVLNTVGNPLALRLRAMADWNARPDQVGLGANMALNFTGAYRDPGSTLVPNVGSLVTIDAQLRYRTAGGTGLLDGLETSFNVSNVFNKSLPFVDNPQGYDASNGQPLGRVISLTVVKTVKN